MLKRQLAMGVLCVAGCTATTTGQRAEAVLSDTTVLTLETPFDLESPDPAVSYIQIGWQELYTTCVKLLNYADVDREIVLVPELAATMPTVSPDGLQFTFTVRDDFQFAPPSNERVTAAVVKRTFERSRHRGLQGRDGAGPGSFFISDVVRIDLPRGDQIRFTLARPSGDFLHRVAMPFFCVVPSTYPFAGQDHPPPGAGPYSPSSYTPVTFDEDGNVVAPGEIILDRNPNYHGDRPAGFDRIRYVMGVAASPEDVLSGAADYLPNGVGPDPDLLAAYGPGAAVQQLFVNPEPGYRYLAINTRRVTDVNVRRAVNFAVDRPAVAAASGMAANDNYLPPGIPGYQGAHLYPIGAPDPAHAAELLGGAHPALNLYVPDREMATAAAEIIQSSLAAAGIAVTIVLIPPFDFYSRLGDPDEPFDLALAGWLADYPDPFDFLNILFRGGDPNNLSHFDDPVFNARLDAAAALLGAARVAAYSQLDLDLMAAAPAAVLGNFNSYDFFSSRVGCQTFNPIYGMDLAALCLRP
jgi:ABC-type transport system substrate-binding protein